MMTLLADCILRIGLADGPALQRIYQREITTKVWTEDEREILMRAFDNRAAQLNAEAIGLTMPRWGQLAEQKGS